MTGKGIPDVIQEHIIKTSQFMENQVKLLEKIEDGIEKRDEFNVINQQRWQTTVETLNQTLLAHNTNTDEKFKNICTAMVASTEESKAFRTNTWEWAKGLITKIVVLAVIVIGGVLGLKTLGV
jgi:hypothetical protein